MSKTLRELVEEQREVGDADHGIPCYEENDYSAGYRAGLYDLEAKLGADAHVYGVCETCGGSRVVKCARCNGVGEVYAPLAGDFDRCNACGGEGEAACPDCGKLSVVTAEVREQAIREGWMAYHRAIHGSDPNEELIAETLYDVGIVHESYVKNMGALTDAVLSTVLGNVRVAKEVLEKVGQLDIECWPSENEPVCHNRVWDDEPVGAIAILEDSDDQG